jgi:Mn2+/Fe2+ NRAMP family transporter
MKRVAGLFLGILTAFGGFIDIGDLVADAQVGSRFGLSLALVTVAAVLIIMCYAEMSARIAMATRRAAFDVLRERLGPKVGLAGLAASFFVTAMLVMAELSGVALALGMATSVSYLLFVPVLAVVAFLIVWKLPFEPLEMAFGLLGLATLVWLVAIAHLSPDWGSLLHGATHPSLPHGEGLPTMLFFAVSLLGAQATPYETFFFSSGAVEQNWTPKKHLRDMRANVVIGFPLGGLLAIAIQAASMLVLAPRGISVQHLTESVSPIAYSMGKIGLAIAILAVFAVTFGATMETLMSTGYITAQFFGWSWGISGRKVRSSRFNAVMIAVLVGAVLFALTTIDPIKVTVYAVVLSAVTIPIIFLPLLIVGNDRRVMGPTLVNGKLANTLGSLSMLVLVPAALLALPLLIITNAGMG